MTAFPGVVAHTIPFIYSMLVSRDFIHNEQMNKHCLGLFKHYGHYDDWMMICKQRGQQSVVQITALNNVEDFLPSFNVKDSNAEIICFSSTKFDLDTSGPNSTRVCHRNIPLQCYWKPSSKDKMG